MNAATISAVYELELLSLGNGCIETTQLSFRKQKTQPQNTTQKTQQQFRKHHSASSISDASPWSNSFFRSLASLSMLSTPKQRRLWDN